MRLSIGQCQPSYTETQCTVIYLIIGIYGGAGFRPLGIDRMKSDGTPMVFRTIFEQSIDKVWNEEVDINLGNHPFHNDTFEKYERRKREGGNPFVDSTEWHRFLQELKDCYHTFIQLSEEEIHQMVSHSAFLTYRSVCLPYLDNKAVFTDIQDIQPSK